MCLVILLLALGWATELMPMGKRGPNLAQALAIVSVVAINVAIQPVQLGLRILIVETCHSNHQTLASAWAARMTGVGNILAQVVGSLDTTKLKPVLSSSQSKNMCLITSMGLVLNMLVLISLYRWMRTRCFGLKMRAILKSQLVKFYMYGNNFPVKFLRFGRFNSFHGWGGFPSSFIQLREWY